MQRHSKKRGFSLTLEEENLTSESLVKNLESVQKKSEGFRRNMKRSQKGEALQTLVNEINKTIV